MRKVRTIQKAVPVNMGGIELDQPLPFGSVDQIDPFLLIHHWDDELPGERKSSDLGVGPHPHRGFSPVTFLFKGAVFHQDSRGHRSLVKAGGTQWLDSGMGIVHSERPSGKLADEGGPFELIQFWVNLPADRKMDEPVYQPLSAEDTPIVELPGGKGSIAVVTGQYAGIDGPIRAKSPLLALRMDLQPGAKVEVPIPEGWNALTYVLDGELEAGASRTAADRDLIWWSTEGGDAVMTATSATRAIMLAGQPIGEPLATYGPFVMNHQTQIMQALRDYQMGKMGVLIEEFGPESYD